MGANLASKHRAIVATVVADLVGVAGTARRFLACQSLLIYAGEHSWCLLLDAHPNPGRWGRSLVSLVYVSFRYAPRLASLHSPAGKPTTPTDVHLVCLHPAGEVASYSSCQRESLPHLASSYRF